jgi:hypothetical protein
MAPALGEKIKLFGPKDSARRRAPDLENQESKPGTQIHSILRIQFASHESKLGPRKLDPRPSSQVGLMVFHCKTPFDSL